MTDSIYTDVLRRAMDVSTLLGLILEDLRDETEPNEDLTPEREALLDSFLESFRTGFEAGALVTFPAWAHMSADALVMLQNDAKDTPLDIEKQCYHAGRADGFKWAASVDELTRRAFSNDAAVRKARAEAIREIVARVHAKIEMRENESVDHDQASPLFSDIVHELDEAGSRTAADAREQDSGPQSITLLLDGSIGRVTVIDGEDAK